MEEGWSPENENLYDEVLKKALKAIDSISKPAVARVPAMSIVGIPSIEVRIRAIENGFLMSWTEAKELRPIPGLDDAPSIEVPGWHPGRLIERFVQGVTDANAVLPQAMQDLIRLKQGCQVPFIGGE